MLFDIAQSTKNNDGGHSILASFLPLADLDATSWPGLIASPSTNAETITLDAGDIVAVTGKKWIKISSETEMIGSTIGSEGSEGSVNMVGQPSIKFNNLTAEEIGFLKSVKNVPGIWVLKTRSGDQWYYGSPDFPAKATEASGEFGTNTADDKTATLNIRAVEFGIYPGSISYTTVA